MRGLDWKANPSQMYLLIDYKELGTRIGVDEIEFLKCKVDDEINLLLFPQGKYDPDNIFLVGTENSQKRAHEVLEELKLPQFSNVTFSESLQILKTELPVLTGQEKRVSLQLMRPKPSITKMQQQLRGPAATSTSNINVMTKAEVRAISIPVSKKSKDIKVSKLIDSLHLRINKPKKLPEITQETIISRKTTQNDKIANRRHSLVGDSLPAYIVKQLQPSNSGAEDEREDETTRRSRPRTTGVELSGHQSRFKNLVDTSKQMYARTKDVESLHTDHNGTTVNNTTDKNSRPKTNYDDIEDEDEEYILPQLLTRIYGEMNDSPANGEDEDDYYAYSDEDNDNFEEEVDFVNLNGSLDTNRRTVTEGSDSEDYLF